MIAISSRAKLNNFVAGDKLYLHFWCFETLSPTVRVWLPTSPTRFAWDGGRPGSLQKSDNQAKDCFQSDVLSTLDQLQDA